MKLKLVVWSPVPSYSILKKAFKKALESFFLKRAYNLVLLSELHISFREIIIFIKRAFYEVPVNIYYGLPNKFKKFDKRINEILKTTEEHEYRINFFKVILKILKTKPVLKGNVKNLNNILQENNPVLLIANHPYVPIDGFLIMSIVHKHRFDYSFVINSNNFMHSIYPLYSKHLIPVKMTGGPLGVRDNNQANKTGVRALKKCIERLSNGQCVIIFPAGQGSKASAWGQEIKDPQWLNGVGHIVKHFANNNKPLTILPVFIAEHMGGQKNSQRYLNAVIESPFKLGAALQKSLFNTPPTVNLHIGEALSEANFTGMQKIDITQKLREKVYSLSSEITIATRC